MTLSVNNQSAFARSATSQPTVKKETENLMGVLWYQMLSSLNETGMSEASLGAGGGNFQSMFLWNVAENDFGKYDSGLLNAALHQVGGVSKQAPSVAQIALSAGLPSMSMTISPDQSDMLPITQEPLPDNNADEPQGLAAQATSFAKSVWPQIQAAAKTLGVPAVAVLAQTALETGWGNATPGHNLFGVKAVSGEPGTLRATHEVVDGVLTPKMADFRNYTSSADSVSDFVALVQNSYPDAIGQTSVSGFASALQTGGYATDQNYARKIEQIANSPLMSQVLQSVGVLN